MSGAKSLSHRNEYRRFYGRGRGRGGGDLLRRSQPAQQQSTVDVSSTYNNVSTTCETVTDDIGNRSTAEDHYQSSLNDQQTTSTDKAVDENRTNKQNQRRQHIYHRKTKDSIDMDNVNNRSDSIQLKPCHYYSTTGVCRFGDRCRYSHNTIDQQQQSQTKPMNRSVCSRPTKQALILNSDQLSTDCQLNVRQSDIDYVMRRFIGSRIISTTSIVMTFIPSDPDWPFDVKSLAFICDIPIGYPIELMHIKIDDDEQKKQQVTLPETLSRFITKSIEEHIETIHNQQIELNQFEPIFRVLFRWLDRSILDIFVRGLRRTRLVIDAQLAGISVTLPTKVDHTCVVDDSSSIIVDETNDGYQLDEASKDGHQSIDTQLSSMILSDGSSIGYEIRLTWNDESGNIASISAIRLTLGIRCIRCLTPAEYRLSMNNEMCEKCERCQQIFRLKIQPTIVHQHSSIIGRLIAIGCRPVDIVLLTSELQVVCLKCNMQFPLQGIGYGFPFKTWCRECHSKCELVINSIRFQRDSNVTDDVNFSSSNINNSTKITKSSRNHRIASNDPTIVVGQPLPDSGTCKHYKKSFRWFRFPCCGKLYPCDICHELATNQQHEMKYANRMVCGYCSTEQAYEKTKPCIVCHGSVVRIRSAHWEGGKGCRNANTMARNDGRKHANSRAKTVSKRAMAKSKVKNDD